MHFIVDLFRYILFAFCGLVIIGTVLGLLFAMGSGPHPDLTAGTVVVAIAVLLFLVLNLGGIAIVMSLHDRHAELVEQARDINETIARVAYGIEQLGLNEGAAR